LKTFANTEEQETFCLLLLCVGFHIFLISFLVPEPTPGLWNYLKKAGVIRCFEIEERKAPIDNPPLFSNYP